MKIKQWVAQGRDNPIPLLFGRIDALQVSPGDMTPDNGSTIRCVRIAVWVLLGMNVMRTITFGRAGEPIFVSEADTMFRTERF